MANPEHVEILKQGVGAWNKWRKVHCDITPDLSNTSLDSRDFSNANLQAGDLRKSSFISTSLSRANLKDANLSQANLHNANLRAADLCGANLRNANLRSTNLREADLGGADLRGSNLRGAILRSANLSNTDLSGVVLSKANLIDIISINANLSRAQLNSALLRGTNLSGAILSGANLSRADLTNGILSNADLSGANFNNTILSNAKLSDANLSNVDMRGRDLQGADLSRAILRGTNFSRANLSGANLRDTELIGADLNDVNLKDADLSNANLQKASLQTARLIGAKLDGANITDACLWETQRAGWSIKGVICESVYWDQEAEVKTTYAPGEFERLFADKTMIRLFFKDGISPLEIVTLPALIKHLEEVHPGARLRFVKLHEESGGAVVELAIEADDEGSTGEVKQLQAALQPEAQDKVEELRTIFAEKGALMLLENKFEQLYGLVHQSLQQPKQLTTIHVNQGGSMGDTYNISGQAGAVGPNAEAHDNTFNQLVNHVEQNIDLDQLAKQLGELRLALAQKQDSPQAAVAIGEVAKAEIAAGEKNPSKVVEHLKAAGKWTLDFAKEIGKDLVVDVIKKAMGMPESK